LAYHARADNYDNPRTLRLDRFGWGTNAKGQEVPVINGPTSTPQPAAP
jgi:hypothetical protein